MITNRLTTRPTGTASISDTEIMHLAGSLGGIVVVNGDRIGGTANTHRFKPTTTVYAEDKTPYGPSENNTYIDIDGGEGMVFFNSDPTQ